MTYAWFAIALLAVFVVEASIQVWIIKRSGSDNRLRHWIWETGTSTLLIGGSLLLLAQSLHLPEVWIRVFGIGLIIARGIHVFWLTRESQFCKRAATQVECVTLIGLGVVVFLRDSS